MFGNRHMMCVYHFIRDQFDLNIVKIAWQQRLLTKGQEDMKKPFSRESLRSVAFYSSNRKVFYNAVLKGVACQREEGDETVNLAKHSSKVGYLRSCKDV